MVTFVVATDLQNLVQEHLGSSVITNCDPNHYAKGLMKNVTNLCSAYLVLHNVTAKLKQHFLIGTLSSPLVATTHFVNPSQPLMCFGKV